MQSSKDENRWNLRDNFNVEDRKSCRISNQNWIAWGHLRGSSRSSQEKIRLNRQSIAVDSWVSWCRKENKDFVVESEKARNCSEITDASRKVLARYNNKIRMRKKNQWCAMGEGGFVESGFGKRKQSKGREHQSHKRLYWCRLSRSRDCHSERSARQRTSWSVDRRATYT